MVDDKNAEDGDVYDHDGREHLVDDDEMSPEEEAFMEGYDEEDQGNGEDKPTPGDEAYEEAFNE
mgnify:CR=1 FL=1